MLKKLIKNKKSLKRMGITIAVIVIAYLNINFCLNYKINGEIQKLKSNGQVTELYQLEKEFVRSENRAALYLAAGDVAYKNSEFSDFPQEEQDIMNFYEKNKEKIKEDLEKNNLSLELMEQSMDFANCNFKYQYEKGFEMQVPNFLALRKTAQVLVFKAMDDIDQGNYDEALKRCSQCLSLGIDLANENSPLINHMISVAIVKIGLMPLKYMADNNINADYSIVSQELKTIKDTWGEVYIKSLEAERTFGMDAYKRLLNNTFPLGDYFFFPGNLDSNVWFLTFKNMLGSDITGKDLENSIVKLAFNKIIVTVAKPYILADELHYIKCMNMMIEKIKKDPTAEINIDEFINKYMISAMLIPNLSKASMHNQTAISDCNDLLKKLK